MLNIAIYSLTRDRIEYTAECFARLKACAGKEYDHFIVDNGSTDDTPNWLKHRENEFAGVLYNKENQGISIASNQALRMILEGSKRYDLIIKMDNDCFIGSEKILAQVEKIYESLGKFDGKYVLSPKVELINHQPTRAGVKGIADYTIGLTAIVGGLFHIVQREVYEQYRYPENLPKAKGQDDDFCHWFKTNGGQVGYIEELFVEHKDGTDEQAKIYSEYFKRKWQEETI